MKLTLILCDSAQVADGKLFLMGGGWAFTGPQPVPHALGVLLEVPWDRTNQPIKISIELLEQDGSPVTQPGPVGGEVPIRVDAELEVGRPPGHPKGTPLNVPLAIPVPPIALAPGRRFSWEAHIEGEPAHEDWHVSFATRPAPAGGLGPSGFTLPGQ